MASEINKDLTRLMSIQVRFGHRMILQTLLLLRAFWISEFNIKKCGPRSLLVKYWLNQ